MGYWREEESPMLFRKRVLEMLNGSAPLRIPKNLEVYYNKHNDCITIRIRRTPRIYSWIPARLEKKLRAHPNKIGDDFFNKYKVRMLYYTCPSEHKAELTLLAHNLPDS